MYRTDANIRSWIAFRFSFYMALINRCNIWTQLNTLNPFTNAARGHNGAPGPCCAAATRPWRFVCGRRRLWLPQSPQWVYVNRP